MDGWMDIWLQIQSCNAIKSFGKEIFRHEPCKSLVSPYRILVKKHFFFPVFCTFFTQPSIEPSIFHPCLEFNLRPSCCEAAVVPTAPLRRRHFCTIGKGWTYFKERARLTRNYLQHPIQGKAHACVWPQSPQIESWPSLNPKLLSGGISKVAR